MSAPLIDSHCHLDIEAFDADREAVIARARAAGLVRIVLIGSGRREKGPHGALALAASDPTFFSPTTGIHPHDASLADADRLAELARLAALPEVVAIGETGLDFHYDHAPRDRQREAFRAQLAIARSVKKPVVVHTRLAAQETLDTLREEHAADVGGIMHCFSEDAAFAKAALDLGFVCSFSGIVTFPKAAGVLDAARSLPLDSLLVETDAPYLAPIPHRGRRCEPAFVAATAAAIARARGIGEDELRAATTKNACRVFGLPCPI